MTKQWTPHKFYWIPRTKNNTKFFKKKKQNKRKSTAIIYNCKRDHISYLLSLYAHFKIYYKHFPLALLYPAQHLLSHHPLCRRNVFKSTGETFIPPNQPTLVSSTSPSQSLSTTVWQFWCHFTITFVLPFSTAFHTATYTLVEMVFCFVLYMVSQRTQCPSFLLIPVSFFLPESWLGDLTEFIDSTPRYIFLLNFGVIYPTVYSVRHKILIVISNTTWSWILHIHQSQYSSLKNWSSIDGDFQRQTEGKL